MTTLRSFCLAAILAAFGAPPVVAQDAAAPEPTAADFAAHIRPIFKTHCIECHSGKFPRGGLDLDSVQGATKRGDSSGPILGSDLTTNELWQRISTDDETLRMPKGADALSAAELDTIRAWLLANAPWPEHETVLETPPPAAPPLESTSPPRDWFEREPFATLARFEEYSRPVPGRTWWCIGLIFGNLVFLILERRRRAYEQRMQTAGRPLPEKRSLLHRINASHQMGFLAIVGLAFVGMVERSRRDAAEEKTLGLEQQLERYTGSTSTPRHEALFGSPPKPIRLRHAKGLSKTFYRGNCEVSESLFNQGNYCTAIFKLQLVDSDGRPVEAKDAIPASGLLIDFVMKRAPGATQQLFAPGVIRSLFVSSHDYGAEPEPRDPSLQQFETAVDDWEWRCRIPLPKPTDKAQTGVIYLYKGEVREETAYGEAHYGIVYELPVADGRLSVDADLWMGALYFSSAVQLPEKDRLPPTEWLDVRPLPFISGKNTSDPKLLGVEEHLGRSAEADSEPPLRAPR